MDGFSSCFLPGFGVEGFLLRCSQLLTFSYLGCGAEMWGRAAEVIVPTLQGEEVTCPRSHSELVVELSYGHLTPATEFSLLQHMSLSSLENTVATAKVKRKRG